MPERTRSRSFAPTVLLGLAGATLAAVAGAQDWARASGDAAGVRVVATADGSEAAPLAVALALVCLAAWGVVLVLRGRVRRFVAGVGVLAALGVLVATVTAFQPAQDAATAAVTARGATGDAFTTSLTAWYYAAAVGAVLTLATFVVAVVALPGWPAMGTRYDAPAGRATEPAGDRDLWRALDEGEDPTA